jgi:dTDP-4-amino-4,6-dideoxygalactose transaminase
MINLFNINDYVVDTSKFSHSLHGHCVLELEKKICDFVGAKYACAVSSATNAIFLSLLGKNVTVNIPSMIPPVVLNAIINSGNKINFYDNVEWVGDSYILHDFGDYKIIDSAQKLQKAQFIKEAKPADLMIFSFYPTKPIGGLDGGMIVTNDYDKIRWFREAAYNGMTYDENSWNRQIVFPGWKMYMSSFQAHVVLQNFNKYQNKKNKLCDIRKKYNFSLGYDNISEHLYRINVLERDKFITNMKKQNISCGIHYDAAHLHAVYKKYNNSILPKTEKITTTTVSIPYHENLTDEEINKVIKCVKNNT